RAQRSLIKESLMPAPISNRSAAVCRWRSPGLLPLMTAMLAFLSTWGKAICFEAPRDTSLGLLQQRPEKAEEDQKALEEFKRLYSLPDGEILKRIAPPF